MSTLARVPVSQANLARPVLDHAASHSRFCIQPLPHSTAPTSTSLAPAPSPRPHVTAMANPRRQKMVAQQIRREVSEMLLFDKTIRDTMTPEHALGADRYLSSVASVSEVEVSGDLQVAKVYVSVYGDEMGQERAMAGLKSLTGYVRQGLGKRMRLRFTPEVRFIQDEAIERGSRVLSILSQLEREREAKERGEAVPKAPMLADEDEDDDYFDDFGNFGTIETHRSNASRQNQQTKQRKEEGGQGKGGKGPRVP